MDRKQKEEKMLISFIHMDSGTKDEPPGPGAASPPSFPSWTMYLRGYREHPS